MAGEQEYTCDGCGDTFTRYPSQVRGKRTFCSVECKNENWVTGPEHGLYDPDIREPCEQCGEEFKRRARRENGQDRFCSPECWSDWCEEHPERREWEGYGHGWKEARDEIRERDGVCQICGGDGTEHRLEVHHIVPVREFEQPEDAHFADNLVLLCGPCHWAAEHGRTQKLLRRASSYEAMRNITPAETTGEA